MKQPSISVVMPVLNEESALPGTLQALARQNVDYELIVVDGGSTDRTGDLIRQIPTVTYLSATRGRASQMNRGARAAQGEWLLFLHADTWLPPDAFEGILAAGLAGADAGGFTHLFSGDDWRLNLISRINNRRCRSDLVFFGDQAIFVRRSLFERMGGYDEQTLMEDKDFSDRLHQYTTPAMLDAVAVTDSRKFVAHGVWLSFWRCVVLLVKDAYGFHTGRPHPFFENVRR